MLSAHMILKAGRKPFNHFSPLSVAEWHVLAAKQTRCIDWLAVFVIADYQFQFLNHTQVC